MDATDYRPSQSPVIGLSSSGAAVTEYLKLPASAAPVVFD
jgi:hypothetical protein